MDCKSANGLMMKYMDLMLTENEAQSLNIHILSCAVCKEDFMLYEQLITEFEKQSACLFEPPDGFEERVMEKIAHIVPDYVKTYSQDSVVGFVFGAFSMLFGAGVMLSMYQAEIIALVANYPYAEAIMETAVKFSDLASDTVYSLSQKAVFYFNGAFALLDAAKYVILTIVAGLVAAQCFIYSRSKVEI